MIIEEHADHCLFRVDDGFRALLQKLSIFQTREGMDNLERGKYIQRLKEGDTVHIGKHATIEQYATLAEGYNFFSCGAFTSCASEIRHTSTVGRYCSIAENVRHFGFRHPIDAVSTSSAFFNFNRENVSAYIDDVQKKDGRLVTPRAVPTPQPDELPIKIGNDVWIGMNVSLAGGIIIGDGAVVAAYSVVTKDVSPYAVVAGIPAVFKKFRFPKEIVERLIYSRWWEYELADIYQTGLDFSNPVRFLEELESQQMHLRKLSVKSLSVYATVKKLELVKLFGLNIINQRLILTQHGTILVFCQDTKTVRHITTSALFNNSQMAIPIVIADKANPRLAIIKQDEALFCTTSGVVFSGLVGISYCGPDQFIPAQQCELSNRYKFRCSGGFLGAAPNGDVYFDAKKVDAWETFQIL